jgi:hypothetical protein
LASQRAARIRTDVNARMSRVLGSLVALLASIRTLRASGLPLHGCTASMMPMPSRKAARSLVSLIAVVSLLLCQAVWAGVVGPGRLSIGVGSTAGAAAPSCHDPAGTDVPGTAAPSPCDIAQLPSDEVRLTVFAAAVLVVAFVMRFASEHPTRLNRSGLAHPAGIPPPLRLLHCIFRN